MPKTVSVFEFKKTMGKYVNNAYKERDYLIVANGKKGGESFVVTNISMFASLLDEANYKEGATIIRDVLKDINIKVHEKYSLMGKKRFM